MSYDPQVPGSPAVEAGVFAPNTGVPGPGGGGSPAASPPLPEARWKGRSLGWAIFWLFAMILVVGPLWAFIVVAMMGAPPWAGLAVIAACAAAGIFDLVRVVRGKMGKYTCPQCGRNVVPPPKHDWQSSWRTGECRHCSVQLAFPASGPRG